MSAPNGNTVEESRHIEIKAKLGSDDEYNRRVDIAKKLVGNEGEIIVQRDVFYNVSSGRLKLRFLENSPSLLVQYSRPDTKGPKMSQLNIIKTSEPDVLNKMLAASIGCKGEVLKRRHLFLHNQTRIHLDQVQGLGNFLEFEVCLQPDETTEYGTTVANEMMQLFEIKENYLIAGAYLDAILK